MFKKASFVLFLLLMNISLLAKSKYETVVLQPNDNIESVLKSSYKKYVIFNDFDLKGKEVVIGANSIFYF